MKGTLTCVYIGEELTKSSHIYLLIEEHSRKFHPRNTGALNQIAQMSVIILCYIALNLL